MFELSEQLVPIDFSPTSKLAFEQACRFASGDSPVVILLHVVDTSLVNAAVEVGLGSREEVVGKMRERAERELAAFQPPEGTEVHLDSMVMEGSPFLEIINKAEDFHVDAVVMGKVGLHGKAENLLFGSTVEKVLRGCSRPVIVLPSSA